MKNRSNGRRRRSWCRYGGLMEELLEESEIEVAPVFLELSRPVLLRLWGSTQKRSVLRNPPAEKPEPPLEIPPEKPPPSPTEGRKTVITPSPVTREYGKPETTKELWKQNAPHRVQEKGKGCVRAAQVQPSPAHLQPLMMEADQTAPASLVETASYQGKPSGTSVNGTIMSPQGLGLYLQARGVPWSPNLPTLRYSERYQSQRPQPDEIARNVAAAIARARRKEIQKFKKFIKMSSSR